MFRELEPRVDDRALEADEANEEFVCPVYGPPVFGSVGYACTLRPHSTGTHLAGIGNGYVVAEWDDNRDTDERI